MREIDRLREESKTTDDKLWPGDPRVWRDDSQKFQFGLGGFLTTLFVVSIAIGLFVNFPPLIYLAALIAVLFTGFLAFCGSIGVVFSLFTYALYSLANDDDPQRKRENINTARQMLFWCFAAILPFVAAIVVVVNLNAVTVF